MSDANKTLTGPLTILRRLGKLSLALALLAPTAACEAGYEDDFEMRAGDRPPGEDNDGSTSAATDGGTPGTPGATDGATGGDCYCDPQCQDYGDCCEEC